MPKAHSHIILNNFKVIYFFICVLVFSLSINASEPIKEKDEAEVVSSEVLISQTENKAIDTIQTLLRKKKGTPEEPDMWFRLAELYMRKAKSERFFDLFTNTKTEKLSIFPTPDQRGTGWLKKAIETYSKIEKDFPKYNDMDAVIFNNAFAHQQTGKYNEAIKLYIKLNEKYPSSSYFVDGLVSLAELLYDQRKFAMALEYFSQMEKFPQSKSYPYAIYKMAWTYYNMRDSENGVKKLLKVVEMNPPPEKSGENIKYKQNLRREALRDLTVFIGDSYAAKDLYPFFKKICTDEELGLAMMDLAKLYVSHSRQKEMRIFLDEFIFEKSNNVYLVRAHLYLVDAYEYLKNRDKAIEHLKISSHLCVVNSEWRIKLKREIPDESCNESFRQTAYELAEKWWEIWLKNKNHAEFTLLTEKIIRIIIENENKEKPDIKMHYAFAEVLFYLQNNDEASEQYKFVYDRSDDPKLKHDSLYSSLFTKEKSILKDSEKKLPKSDLKEGQRKDLALLFIKKFPKSEHFYEVHIKLASIYYDENNLEESQKYLNPLIAGKGGRELQIKSEDLQLDILNLKKDFSGIAKFSEKFLQNSPTSERKTNLQKIMHQAAYAEIQKNLEKADRFDAANELVKYNKSYPQSPMAQDALWQGLNIYFSEGYLYLGAKTGVEYYNKYPSDKRSLALFKDSAKYFAETGHIKEAIDVWQKLSILEKNDHIKNMEIVADLYVLEHNSKESRQIYKDLISKADSKNRSRLFTKLLLTFNDKESSEYQKLQNQILSLNIEPYASEMLLKRAEEEFQKGKFGASFETARKLTARDAPGSIRASGRLIQAKILEGELVRQSVKTTKADRLGLVLSLKTDKLEKALSAYLGAAKMSSDSKTQFESLSGVDRCYQNFIESFRTIELPQELADSDKQALLKEIKNITVPMEDKRKDNQKSIQKISKARSLSNEEYNWSETSVEINLVPKASYPNVEFLQPYFLLNQEFVFSRIERFDIRTSVSCPEVINTTIDAAKCFFQKNYIAVEKWALDLASQKRTQVFGLYYLSLVAEAKGSLEKALWLNDLALQLHSDAPVFLYQKGRITYKLEGLKNALPFFDKVLDMQMSSPETETFIGIRAFIDGDFETAVQKFSAFSNKELYNLNIGILYSEAYARLGKVDQAVKIISELADEFSKDPQVLMQKAQLEEFHKLMPQTALKTYEKIMRISTKPDLSNWLERKINYLKGKVDTKK